MNKQYLKYKDKMLASSKLYYRNNIEKIKKQLIKCILVCANCHRIIHFEKDNQ